jgi:hypothetical protein
MDYLLTDETLENRKKHIPAAIIEEIKEEFNVWTKGRKFAPHPCIEGQIECYKKIRWIFKVEKFPILT